jgi:hypothetical protein
MVVTLGVLISTAGIVACGRAGVLREQSGVGDTSSGARSSAALVKGLLVCVIAGVCSSGSNIAFSYGQTIKDISQQQFGNPSWLATLAVWMLVFCGAFAASGSYAVWLLFKNGTWSNFTNRDAVRNLSLAFAMAALHFATLFCYGIGAHYLGKLGTSVGYALMMSCSLLVANAMGFMTGEWRGANAATRRWIFIGLALLLAGILALAVGNSLQAAILPPE